MWFCIPFVVGGIFEIIGYVGRAMAHDATGKLVPYILQSTFLLIGPILFAASLYMTLSRVIRAVDGGESSIITPRWLTRIFVFGDVFSFLIQVSGSGLRVQAGTGKSSIDPKLGSYVIVGGLVFQIIIFGLYIVTTAMFHCRFTRSNVASQAIGIPWRSTLHMLYITSVLVMVRNIFRTVEYAMGNNGYLLGVEWPVYVFDASLMTLTMACFLWQYPNQLRPLSKREGC
ncbi:hypothetical protein SLS60_005817 [Paraconiothyrium brasiliense]|uniref:RTA1 like protein n=1 Tax=Paraconiothyrium brasiliense TaxID=300254 RepID=A0ABR3RDA4_9PLEO